MSLPKTPQYFKDLLRIIIVFGAYFATARWGLSLDAVSGFAAFVWPPSGLALAAVLLWGYRIVPGITIAAFLVNLTAGASPISAFAIGIGNTLEAVIAVYLLRHIGSFENSVSRLRDVFVLVILACICATFVAATVGTTSLYLAGAVAGSLYIKTWIAWWIGDALGILIVTPLLLAWSKPLKASEVFNPDRRMLEAVLAFSLLVLANLFVFHNVLIPGFKNAPTGFVIFPFIIWIAVSFGVRGVTLSALITSAIAIWGTSLGNGVFVRETFSGSLFFLQLFMFIISLIGLTLAAINRERVKYQELLMAHEGLEQEVANRIKELKKAQETVENQLRLKTELELKEKDFISVASHELQTPLALIRGYLSMIISGSYGKVDKQILGFLKESLKGTDRLTRLVRDLLTTSRIDAERIHLDTKAFDLNVLLREIVGSFEQKLKEKGLNLNFKPIGKTMVLADYDRVSEVVSNLVDNAVKFTKKGIVTVSVLKEDGFAKVEVGDTGIGIEASSLLHIFEKFYFTKASLEREQESTGLGLYIVKSLVSVMGGTIKVESKVGRGSKFTFTLPLADALGKPN